MRWLEICGEGVAQTPALRPAIWFDGQAFVANGRKATHLDALATMPLALKARAYADGDNRGFVTATGRYLDRFAAARYARRNRLYRADTPEWVVNAPELTAEYLNLYGSHTLP